MKAASGELNLTVITIIAIAAILGFFTVFLYPRMRNTITNQWDGINRDGEKFVQDQKQKIS